MYRQLSSLKCKDSPCPGFPAYPLPAQEAVRWGFLEQGTAPDLKWPPDELLCGDVLCVGVPQP